MSNSRSGPPPIVFILALVGLLGGGYYAYSKGLIPGVGSSSGSSPAGATDTSPTATMPAPANPSASSDTPTAPSGTVPALPDSLPAGSQVRVDGSTSLVVFNKEVGAAFTQKYPGVNYTWKANGSSKGIKALLAGEIDVAASSRPLSDQEKSQGLVAVPVKTDAIAILVGKANPYDGSLTSDQLRMIFSGKATNWSQVGGPPLPLRVINRNSESGTYKVFQDAVLGGAEFGVGSNWFTMPKDVTTELLQKLGTNGIGYANYSEIKTQRTIRALTIDGQAPGTPSYPFATVLYYVYAANASSAAQAFVAFASGSEGQQIAAAE